ncbi:Virus Gp157 [Gammaproteobacteria bacterium]
MKLYEIAAAYQQALDFLTNPEVDIPPEAVNDTIEALEGDFDQKAVNIAAFARQMEIEAEAIKAAEDAMDKRRRALENRAKWLREYVKYGMESIGRKKVTSAWFVLSIQKNPASLDVFDGDMIPAEYLHEVTEVRMDRAAIKNALAAGLNIPGAKLIQGTRLVIR